MSDFLYALADTVVIWRPIAILVLCGIVCGCIGAFLAAWGK